MRHGLSLVAFVGATSLSSNASADVQHIIGKGHTIEAIANRYGVSAKSIIVANHLKDVRRLKVGDVLTIPKTETPKKAHKDDDKDAKGKDAKGKDKSGKEAKAERSSYAAKPKTPGVIHIRRPATTEELDLRVTQRGGKIAPATLQSIEKIMRAPSGARHPIEARLVALLGIVSNHFGSRKIEVISGFRPYTPTQYTPHSNHNHGRAVDFRVVGVPNEVVRDFCRTLRNVGCGYYPNSTFVHMDVRDSSAFWIDYARPGEPPRYNAPNVDADEGTSDVHSGAHPSANTAPEPTPEPTPELAPTPEPAPALDSEPTLAPSESEPAPGTKPSDE